MLALVFAQTGWALVLLATAWAAGWIAWGRRSPDSLLHPFTTCLGLALLGELALLLAACRLFRPPLLIVATVLLHVAALPGWRQLGSRFVARARPHRETLFGAALVVLAAAGPFAIALLPPTAFDETTYHLPLARSFLESAGLPWVPELRYPTFPALGEGLQAALLSGGERAAHLVAVVAVVATAMLLLAWGREAAAAPAGWFAIALFVGSPLVAFLGGTGYVETLLACCVTTSCYALWRADRDGGAGWAAMAGFCGGAAAAVKYLGLFWVAAGGAVLLLRRERRGRAVAACAAAAVAALAIPYGYLLLRTGNPLFPFFGDLFGASPWDRPAADGALGERLVRALALPWNATFDRALAGEQPPLSPALVLTSPVLLWGAARDARVRTGVVLCLLFVLALAVTDLTSHYLAAILPLWSLLVGASACALWQRRGGPTPAAAGLLALALVAPAPLYGAFFVARLGGVPVTATARESYLARAHHGYAALAWLNRREGSAYTAYGVHCEHLHAFASGRLLGDWSGPHRYERILPLLGRPALLHEALRRYGADHLLLPRGLAPALSLPPSRQRFTLLHRDAELEVWALSPGGQAQP